MDLFKANRVLHVQQFFPSLHTFDKGLLTKPNKGLADAIVSSSLQSLEINMFRHPGITPVCSFRIYVVKLLIIIMALSVCSGPCLILSYCCICRCVIN